MKRVQLGIRCDQTLKDRILAYMRRAKRDSFNALAVELLEDGISRLERALRKKR